MRRISHPSSVHHELFGLPLFRWSAARDVPRLTTGGQVCAIAVTASRANWQILSPTLPALAGSETDEAHIVHDPRPHR